MQTHPGRDSVRTRGATAARRAASQVATRRVAGDAGRRDLGSFGWTEANQPRRRGGGAAALEGRANPRRIRGETAARRWRPGMHIAASRMLTNLDPTPRFSAELSLLLERSGSARGRSRSGARGPCSSTGACTRTTPTSSSPTSRASSATTARSSATRRTRRASACATRATAPSTSSTRTARRA